MSVKAGFLHHRAHKFIPGLTRMLFAEQGYNSKNPAWSEPEPAGS